MEFEVRIICNLDDELSREIVEGESLEQVRAEYEERFETNVPWEERQDTNRDFELVSVEPYTPTPVYTPTVYRPLPSTAVKSPPLAAVRSIEQIVRDVLTAAKNDAALWDELMSGRDPQALTSGDIVAPANVLAEALRKKKEANHQ